MIEPLSQSAKAMRNTTVRWSTGAAFRSVCQMYGLPFPDEVPVSSWRQGVLVMAFGSRGTPGTTFAFLEAVTSHKGTDIPVTQLEAAPLRLTSPDSLWTASHVGRWVRLKGAATVHLITAVDGAGAWADVCPVGTSIWQAGDFVDGVDVATVLPFTFAERGGGPGTGDAKPALLEVVLFLEGLSTAPPTYLQPGAGSPPSPDPVSGDTDYNAGALDPVPEAGDLIGAEERPVGQPWGGHVLEDESVSGDQTDGPFPIYLQSSAVLPNTRAVLDAMLPSGCKVTMERGIL